MIFLNNKYNHHNRRKYSLKAHIVLVTKYRKQILKGNIAKDVKTKINIISTSCGYKIITMKTDKEHIHILLEYNTTDRICDIIKIIKQQTTYFLWQNIIIFCPNIIGKRNFFGLMDILLVV